MDKKYKEPFMKVDLARTLQELCPGEVVLFDDTVMIKSVKAAASRVNANLPNRSVRVRNTKDGWTAINIYDGVRKEPKKVVITTRPSRKIEVSVSDTKQFLNTQLVLYRRDESKTMKHLKRFFKNTEAQINYSRTHGCKDTSKYRIKLELIRASIAMLAKIIKGEL